jgi:surface antigen
LFLTIAVTIAKGQFMRHGTLLIIAIAAFGLSGCVGAGIMAARTASNGLSKEKSPAERFSAMQLEAISAAHGGSPGVPIPWSDAKLGIEGAFLLEPNGNAPEGCHQYQQTIIIAGETLQGRIIACPQKDGSWNLAAEALSTGE